MNNESLNQSPKANFNKESILRIATFNVHADDITNNKVKRTELIKQINADVYLLQEATKQSFSNINTIKYNYHYLASKDRSYGQAIGYNQNWSNPKINEYYLPNINANGQVTDGYKSFLVMEYAFYVIACVHLDVHDNTGKIRVKQIKHILKILEQYKNKSIILGGDFNANIETDYDNLQQNNNGKDYLSTNKSKKFPLDFITIQTLKKSNIFKKGNSFELLNKSDEVIMTSIYGSRVDFIFTSPEVTLSDTNAINFNFTNKPNPSDHLPVFIDIPLEINYDELIIVKQNIQGNMGGSNPKSLVKYRNKNYVLKISISSNIKVTLSRSINEVLTSKLYQLFGIKTPNLILVNATVSHDKKYHVVSEMIDNYVDLTMIENKKIRDDVRKKIEDDELYQKQIIEGYYIDILLGNMDIAGENINTSGLFTYSNIGIIGPRIKERIKNFPFKTDPLDEIIRIDVGAGLLYRAQGERKTKKAFGNVPIERFLQPVFAKQPKKLFESIANSYTISLEHLNNVDEERIIETLDMYSKFIPDYNGISDVEYLKTTLINRLQYLKIYFKEYLKNQNSYPHPYNSSPPVSHYPSLGKESAKTIDLNQVDTINKICVCGKKLSTLQRVRVMVDKQCMVCKLIINAGEDNIMWCERCLVHTHIKCVNIGIYDEMVKILDENYWKIVRPINLDNFYNQHMGSEIIGDVRKALKNKNEKSFQDLLDIYVKNKKLLQVGKNNTSKRDKILKEAKLYNKYGKQLDDLEVVNMDFLAIDFNSIVNLLKIKTKDEITLLKIMRKYKLRFSNKYVMTNFSNTGEDIDNYIKKLRHLYPVNIKNINKNVLLENTLSNKLLSDIININDQSDQIKITSEYNDIMFEHKRLSNYFFKTLLSDFDDSPEKMSSIIIAFYVYTLEYEYKDLQNKLFENHEKNINIYFLQNSKKILERPFDELFSKNNSNNSNNYVIIDPESVFKLEIFSNDFFDTITVDKKTIIVESIKSIHNQKIYYNQIGEIIISVFIEWEKFLIKELEVDGSDYMDLKILSFTGSEHDLKQNKARKDYSIKTLESSTYDLSIATVFATNFLSNLGNLNIYVTNITKIINIEILSSSSREKEVIIFNPNAIYDVYDTKKDNIQVGEDNPIKFKKIYLISTNSQTLNNVVRNQRKNGLDNIVNYKKTVGGSLLGKKTSSKTTKKTIINKTQYVIKIVNGRKRKVYTGPKGGNYIISKNNKIYLKKFI